MTIDTFILAVAGTIFFIIGSIISIKDGFYEELFKNLDLFD